MPSNPSDRCKVPPAFWRAIEREGLSPSTVLRQARLPVNLHLNESAVISTDRYFDLWRAVEILTDIPTLGLQMVQRADTGSHPPASLSAFFARDYRDGLIRMARFMRLCSPEKLLIEEGSEETIVRIEWPFATKLEPSIATDITFATLVELGRRGTRQRICPVRIELARPIAEPYQYESYFGCPVHFAAKRNELVLKSSDLDRPFPGHNPEILAILTPALASALEELQPARSVSEQVKTVLKRHLASGRPEIAQVADELGTSDRTLQRRIKEDGTSFRNLLAAARRELGHQLLSDPAIQYDEVAFMLGFQDTSSFHRAFREWEGMTPNNWRHSRDQISEMPR
ncbi:MAG: AraC family transcriptional regulator ligand-binding domain-containing protein [Armatimonadetes bacterium]|nr:AraC family transcriptional regulator ligand-binding domain-containing protein [Armatimonadota bacterium]